MCLSARDDNSSEVTVAQREHKHHDNSEAPETGGSKQIIMSLCVCPAITGSLATVQLVITEIQSTGIWIHYMWILWMTPVWPAQCSFSDRKSADSVCCFFLSFFCLTVAPQEVLFGHPVCYLAVDIIYFSICTDVAARPMWSMSTNVFQQNKNPPGLTSISYECVLHHPIPNYFPP